MIYNWSPWIGCVKYSAGCDNCFAQKFGAGSKITKLSNQLKSWADGSIVYPCVNSDFFLEEVSKEWRDEAFEIMKKNPNVIFGISTKRAKNIVSPGINHTKNIHLCVTMENQEELENRWQYLRDAEYLHKSICCAPLLEKIDLTRVLPFIECVIADGEIGDPSIIRECKKEWFQNLRNQCIAADISLEVTSVGSSYEGRKTTNFQEMSKLGKEFNYVSKSRPFTSHPVSFNFDTK
jgi:protein gp37